MFTLYTVLLTAHITLVALWVGAGVTLVVLSHQNADAQFAGVAVRFASRWFPPVTGLTALFGIFLWIDGPWDFGELWILLAVVGWIVSSATGATQLTPRVERWAAGDLAARDAFLKLAHVDLVVLVLIIADMVIKPG